MNIDQSSPNILLCLILGMGLPSLASFGNLWELLDWTIDVLLCLFQSCFSLQMLLRKGRINRDCLLVNCWVLRLVVNVVSIQRVSITIATAAIFALTSATALAISSLNCNVLVFGVVLCCSIKGHIWSLHDLGLGNMPLLLHILSLITCVVCSSSIKRRSWLNWMEDLQGF